MPAVYSATSEAEEALAAATAETVIALISAAGTKPELMEFGVSFDGVSTTAEPVQVKLFRATGDGTGTSATVKAWDPDDPAAAAAAKHSYSAEPTKESTPLAHWNVHPQAGLVIQYPPDQRPVADNAATSILLIEVTAPAVVNCAAYMVWVE